MEETESNLTAEEDALQALKRETFESNAPFGIDIKRFSSVANKKEGNDQESKQLPNTFRFKTPKGKKGALKAPAPQSKHYKQKAKRTVSFPKFCQTAIQNIYFTKTYMQRHTMTEILNYSRSTALERSVKILMGVGLKSILRGHNPRP